LNSVAELYAAARARSLLLALGAGAAPRLTEENRGSSFVETRAPPPPYPGWVRIIQKPNNDSISRRVRSS
jgi:hypothetical protein